ncbi:MAG: Na+/H+ antiporter subunit G [Deltaproteobacteria bacterium]|nr:Na+/H+ antiporter subunit G [Deltaproteobacteria bacterium]
MKEVITSLLMLGGAAFAFLAAVGILRLPDLFSRMQAATKCSAFGVTCVMLAVSVHFAELGIVTRAIMTIIFVFLTAPVAAHMIGRAAYFIGVPLWEHTVTDELKGRYDMRTHALNASDHPPSPNATIKP